MPRSLPAGWDARRRRPGLAGRDRATRHDRGRDRSARAAELPARSVRAAHVLAGHTRRHPARVADGDGASPPTASSSARWSSTSRVRPARTSQSGWPSSSTTPAARSRASTTPASRSPSTAPAARSSRSTCYGVPRRPRRASPDGATVHGVTLRERLHPVTGDASFALLRRSARPDLGGRPAHGDASARSTPTSTARRASSGRGPATPSSTRWSTSRPTPTGPSPVGIRTWRRRPGPTACCRWRWPATPSTSTSPIIPDWALHWVHARVEPLPLRRRPRRDRAGCLPVVEGVRALVRAVLRRRRPADRRLRLGDHRLGGGATPRACRAALCGLWGRGAARACRDGRVARRRRAGGVGRAHARPAAAGVRARCGIPSASATSTRSSAGRAPPDGVAARPGRRDRRRAGAERPRGARSSRCSPTRRTSSTPRSAHRRPGDAQQRAFGVGGAYAARAAIPSRGGTLDLRRAGAAVLPLRRARRARRRGTRRPDRRRSASTGPSPSSAAPPRGPRPGTAARSATAGRRRRPATSCSACSA